MRRPSGLRSRFRHGTFDPATYACGSTTDEIAGGPWDTVQGQTACRLRMGMSARRSWWRVSEVRCKRPAGLTTPRQDAIPPHIRQETSETQHQAGPRIQSLQVHRTYRELPPGPRLARYIECYWWSEARDGGPHCVLPDGCVDILFSSVAYEPRGLSVVGLMTAAVIADLQIGQRFFGVRFRPGMASSFVRPSGELTDRTEALENIWGAPARGMNDRLAGMRTPEEMAVVAESFLRPLEPPDAAQYALQGLCDVRISLDQAASNAGMSTRSLRRACLDRAGVSPKYLQRIVRFRKAAESISAIAARGAQPSWAQLAAACGYYDQAHLIRDFQEFAGATPGRFLQSGGAPQTLESAHEQTETRKPD